MPNQAQHILVIHIAGLAQTTLALPALRSLRVHVPESRITVAASAAAADLVRLSGCADEVLTVGRLRHAELLKPTAFYRSTKAISELRHSNFDLAIEFKTNAEGGAVLNFANPAEKLRPAKGSNKGLAGMLEQFTQTVSQKAYEPTHLAHQYLKKLEPLGVRPIEAEPSLATDRAADEQIEKLLLKHKIEFGELLVGIHPGAGRIRFDWFAPDSQFQRAGFGFRRAAGTRPCQTNRRSIAGQTIHRAAIAQNSRTGFSLCPTEFIGCQS